MNEQYLGVNGRMVTVGGKAVKMPQGVGGRDGVTFTPSVSEDGDLSWTNDGGLANPQTVNLKGPKGDTGARGPAGADGAKGADGAPGKDGAKGDKGDPGPRGPQGEQGIQGETGPAGADGKTPVKGTDYFTPADVNEIAAEAAKKVNISNKLDKPANDAAAKAGQLLTKTANGQEWQDREKDVFIVNMTSDEGTSITSSDKTFDEVQVACNAGKCVIVRLDVTSAGTVEYLPLVVFQEQLAVFLTVARMYSFTSLLYITMSPDDPIQIGANEVGKLAFMDTVTKNDLASDVQTSLGKADSALQSAPVTSVNGKTGAVTISVPTVPSTTSILKGNGSGGLVTATRGSDYIASGNIVKQTLVATETTPTENYAINWVYG